MTRAREKTLWTILIVLLLTSTTITGIGRRTAASGGLPIVSLEPPTVTGLVGETFAVDINVTGITSEESLYSWEFEMSFNTTALDAVNVTEGPFLRDTGYSTFFSKKINNTTGTVKVLGIINELPFPPTGAVGNETLCTITFLVEAEGATPLHFEYTELYSIVADDLILIDHTTQPPIAKVSSIISITASPTPITLGKNTTISGFITPERRGVTVTIQYRPAGGSWSAPITVTTDWSSQYSHVWTPTTVGTYELKASWLGDANTESAESEVITIEVVEIHDITLDIGGVSFKVIIESNSTVSNFQLIPINKEIRFNVVGSSDTVGFCNVTIPINLLGDPYIVQVDGLLLTPEETTNNTHSFLYFTYSHNTHTVKINGTTVATPPIALFTFLATSEYAGDPLSFDASASRDPDGNVTSYKWDFDDGTPIVAEADPITTHVYASAGTYFVTLTVIDNQSLTDIATDTVTVSAKHDVAVVNVTLSSNKVAMGERVSINVTVVNLGTETEAFNITVYYDNVIIGTRSVVNLTSGASEILTINWETTDVDPDTYTIKAVASIITGEIDTKNNEFIDYTIIIIAQENSALGVLPYVAAAGVAAITIAAIAFYFLRIRKPKTNITTKISHFYDFFTSTGNKT